MASYLNTFAFIGPPYAKEHLYKLYDKERFIKKCFVKGYFYRMSPYDLTIGYFTIRYFAIGHFTKKPLAKGYITFYGYETDRIHLKDRGRK